MTTSDAISRRTLLQVTAACAACACCAGEARADEGEKPKTFDAGPIDKYKDDGIYDEFIKKPRLLVIRQQDKLFVSSSKCTHRNCTVAPKDDQLVCPCHGSTFDNSGIVLDGPADSSLPRYGVAILNGRVVVDLTKTFVERDGEKPGSFAKV
jgi:Rieske Fe-S protein